MKLCLLFFRNLYQSCKKDEITVYAAQASFFLLLSSVPFLVLLLALIRYIPFLMPEDLLELFLPFVPSYVQPLFTHIFYELKTAAPGAVVSFSSVTALWSASRGIQGIERGLERIAGHKKRRPYLKRRFFHFMYTLLLLPLSILVLPFLAFYGYSGKLRMLLLLTLLSLFISILYALLPAAKIRLSSCLPGAVFTALGWCFSASALSLYFHTFRSIPKLYGHLTSAAVLLLWLYFCLWILFLGEELNQSYRQYNSCIMG